VQRNLQVSWSCYLHPQFVTESLLLLMKEAGCTGVEFGIDAGSDHLLKLLGKSFNTEEVRRASELCHKVGLSFCHSLVFGGPGESK
ncbi:MAG: B12-binding domain-containing radical SAM protein, partial [Desulfobacteraceae bacterium]